MAQIWASSGLSGSLLADVWPRNGLLVARIQQTRLVRPTPSFQAVCTTLSGVGQIWATTIMLPGSGITVGYYKQPGFYQKKNITVRNPDLSAMNRIKHPLY